MEITIPYYEDNSRISNSNIGQYLEYGPAYLRRYLDGKEKGLDASFLSKGSMIHMDILQPDEFWDNYVILDYETPKNQNQKDFAEEVAKSSEFDQNISLVKAYSKYYSCKGKSDAKILQEATDLHDKLSSYIEFIKVSSNTDKEIITWAKLNQCKTIKAKIKEHKKANELLYELPETTEVHNEFHINWEFPTEYSGMKCPCKSLLDRVTFDHTLKQIKLIDIKTTSFIGTFEESIAKYDYKRQLAYYWMAIHWYFKNVLKLDISEYTYETYIIAVSTADEAEVRVFKFTPESIEDKLVIISDTISDICFHLSTNQWDYHREYYEGDGSELAK